MNAESALTVALHRTRHRLSEPGYTPDPCGACKSEAASLLKAMPDGWGIVDFEEWRRELASKSKAAKAYQAGFADGTVAEHDRLLEAIKGL